ncbi:MAG TPA: sugar phosphate isomerase/epimerase [Arthrobacter sp.]|nr:sugar phosphate isomerase/epimerase [Arthrobacter sp.]
MTENASGRERKLGLAQLSLLDTPPPELVGIAAQAGFDFVGVRVRPVTPRERPYDMQPGSPLLAETLARMADTGIRVVDIEFLLLDGSVGRAAWMPMFEAGAALGAEYLTVAASDADTGRLTATLAQMVQDGQEYGITPTLEPISYQQVRSLPGAIAIAEQAGCRVLLDALHYARFGGTLDEVQSMAARIPMLQLCDGPAASPQDREGLVTESRSDRRIPGRGDFPLVELVRAVDPLLPVSVEVAADGLKAELGASEFARQLKAAAGDILRAAARP